MAWVTKNSEEEYKPYNAQTREYTKKEKAANWWDYHKGIVLVVMLAVVLAAMLVKDLLSQVTPDYVVGWVGRRELPVDTMEALERELARYGADLNGDGQVLVEINQYTVEFAAESEQPQEDDGEGAVTYEDPYSQMAGVTKLSADMSDGKVYVFLLEDPAGFVQNTGALQYLDGTLPAEGAADWQNMCYLWQDCPELAGLELGDYTGYTLVDEQTGTNQSVLADVYVARRGVWTEKDAQRFEGCADFWAALTAGAGR